MERQTLEKARHAFRNGYQAYFSHKVIITTAMEEEALQAYKRRHVLTLYPSLPLRQEYVYSISLDLTCFFHPSFQQTHDGITVLSIAVPLSPSKNCRTSSPQHPLPLDLLINGRRIPPDIHGFHVRALNKIVG